MTEIEIVIRRIIAEELAKNSNAASKSGAKSMKVVKYVEMNFPVLELVPKEGSFK